MLCSLQGKGKGRHLFSARNGKGVVAERERVAKKESNAQF